MRNSKSFSYESNQQSAISNQQSAISNQQSAISNQQSAISNQQSAIGNWQTVNLKPLVILLLIFTLTSVKMKGQYQYLDSANMQLRHIFSQITFPNTTTEFLNERSAKLADSLLYQPNNPDTIHQMQWYQVYKEMYYAAHDTLTQIPFNTVMTNANSFETDTIPLGIMDWDFYRIKPQAINTGNYFIFDTVNNYLFDHPSPPNSPFTTDNVFMAVPLLAEAKFLGVVFHFDPANFFFTDVNTLAYYQNGYQLQIDFGDGNGFVNINPFTASFITVTYPSNGEKTIVTRVVYPMEELVIKSSISRLSIVNNVLPVRPDFIMNNIPGMNVGVYTSCLSTGNITGKSIIVVEGYDFLDEIPSQNVGIESIYYMAISNPKIQYLRNFGYDVYVVDWKESKIDMRYNALNLLCLIEHLKSKAVDDQEFVIIGLSMGGVVARFTLNFMESPKYQTLDFSPFFVENSDPFNQVYLSQNPGFTTKWLDFVDDQQLDRTHNTRLLITVDSPHQGANIPLAYQNIYRFFETSLGLILPGTAYLTTSIPQLSIVQILNKKASRQLLKWYSPPLATLSPILSYGPDASHTSFYNQLKAYPNYGTPISAKMLALSNGSLNGDRQQDPNTNLFRNDNDFIIDFDLNTTVRIFWIPIPFLAARANLRTNPNGFGEICSGNLGINSYRIKIKMFGISIKKTFIPIVPLFNSYATNTEPTCVTAGGNIDVFDLNNSSYNGNWNLFGGFLGASVDMSLQSNGTGFCFVPLESALDYTGSQPYNNDILNEDINTKLANTPFDVIAGQVINGSNSLTGLQVWKNHTHLANRNRNDFVYNLTQQPAAGATPQTEEEYAYFTCANVGNYNAKRTFLAQEIGDEELYLENFVTNRTTSYRTEYDLKVNARNPYYEYPSQPNDIFHPLVLDGIYSKEDDFDIASGGFATFFVDGSSPSPSPGLTIASLNSPNYVDRDAPYGICCSSAARLGNTAPPSLIAKAPVVPSMLLFPNPNQEQTVFIEATFKYATPTAQLIIYNLNGQQVHIQQLIMDKNKVQQQVYFQNPTLPNGIYMVQLKTAKEVKTTKLIIN